MAWKPSHLLLLALLGGVSAPTRPALADPAAAIGAASLPPQYQDVGVTEHPNIRLPLNLPLVDDQGKAVRLGDYFKDHRPVVLQLGYFGCPTLCGLMSHALIDTAKQLELKAGKDYQFVFVSVHPAETPSLAAEKKLSYVDAYGHSDEAGGFHFLVGQQRDIEELADAVGFRFHMVSSTREIAHPAVLFVCTPDGRVSRYLYGIQYPPRTLHLSLVEAAAGQIGTTVDQIILFCYHYDASAGGYVMGAVNTMRIGGVLTVLLVASGIFFLHCKENQIIRARDAADAAQQDAALRSDDNHHSHAAAAGSAGQGPRRDGLYL